MSNKSFHLSPEEFRRHGHEVIDWIADYYARIETFPVLSRVKPGEIRASLPKHPPAHGEPFEAMLGDIEKLILPGITHWQSPNFYAYFPCNASAPAILGDLLSSGLGVQGMLVGDEPGVHRVGDACNGLAGRHVGLAGEISVHLTWRRCDSGHGFERVVVRAACGAGTRNRIRDERKRR